MGSIEGWVYYVGVHVCLKENGRLCGVHSRWFEWRIFNRNVFNLCVKSCQYFHMDNILLEMFVHWLSKISSVLRSN